jgi:hypothetical protein
MARPKLPVRVPKPKVDADEQMQNDMAKIQGQKAWYDQPNVSKARKKAVAIKMGNR